MPGVVTYLLAWLIMPDRAVDTQVLDRTEAPRPPDAPSREDAPVIPGS